jgi:hypothetical protein
LFIPIDFLSDFPPYASAIPVSSALPFQVVSDGSDRFAATFTAFAREFWIKHLEVNDLIFEFVFPEYLRQDGSGEKGFGTIGPKLLSSSMSKGNAPVFPAELNLHQTPRCVLANNNFFRVSFKRIFITFSLYA